MRIHSSALSTLEIRKAATVAGVGFTRLTEHGSRKRAAAWDVILTGNSPRNQNGGDEKAATWDQWGIFLNTLFDLDPATVTPYYADAEHFHWATGNRYVDFDLADDHVKGHNWEYTGESAGGGYHVHQCSGRHGCGAIRRYLSGFGTWEAFKAANA